MKKMYYIARIQTWIQLGSIEVLFRDGENWTIVTESGQRLTINDGEYTDLLTQLKHGEGKPEGEGRKGEGRHGEDNE